MSWNKSPCALTPRLRHVVLLDFTGQLDGPADVSAVQLELGVEVLLGGDGGGVVRTGTLGHVTLVKTQQQSHERPLTKGATGGGVCVCVPLRLLPRCEWCVVQQCLRRTAEVSWSLSGNNVERSTTTCSLLYFCSRNQIERWQTHVIHHKFHQLSLLLFSAIF